MRNMCKTLAVALCVCLLGTVEVGCGSTSSGEDKEITSVTTAQSAGESEANMAVESASAEEPGEPAESAVESVAESVAEEAAPASSVTVEEQVLYDADGIKITATGFDGSWAGPELKLLIENNSAKTIVVQARNTSVNGYMVEPMLSPTVAAGKKANDAMTFMSSELSSCGIDTIAELEFRLHIFNDEDWTDATDTDIIRIETSAAATYTQEVDDSGTTLIDSDGIKIVGKGLSENDSFWGPGVILFIENNTDRNITVQVRDVSVNGIMVDSTMSEDVSVGKRAISAVQFFSTDLEENSITDITDVELYFSVADMESWETIYESDVITISF